MTTLPSIMPVQKMYADDDAPIVARCTAEGMGAIALIRVSGMQAIELVASVAQLPRGTSLSHVASHTVHYGYVFDAVLDGRIDQVMFIVMRGPATFTGQDTVEITCHNNPLLIDRIVSLIVAHGARHARSGEFARRAFLAGKIDLVQAEAIHDLITATNESALKASLAQLQGSLSSCMAQLERSLVETVAFVEAAFEFLDEEQRDIAFHDQVLVRWNHCVQQVQDVMAGASRQGHIRAGVRLVLLGATNAGKSTLFNALVRSSRAIVSDIPGTTRDAIESMMLRNGVNMTLVDTAGIRMTDDTIELVGISRTWHEVDRADLILFVIDCSRALRDQLGSEEIAILRERASRLVLVMSKIDLVAAYDHLVDDVVSVLGIDRAAVIPVSVHAQRGMDELERSVSQKIRLLFHDNSAPYLVNDRQLKILEEISQRAVPVRDFIDRGEYELVAVVLKDIIGLMSEMTGKGVTERVFDAVFETFCVGK